MSLIKKIFYTTLFLFVGFNVTAEEVKKVGKFKDWETMVLVKDTGLYVLHNQNLFFKLQKQIKETLGYL